MGGGTQLFKLRFFISKGSNCALLHEKEKKKERSTRGTEGEKEIERVL